MSLSGLNNLEKKAAFSLASVFGLRMLGLFMILPIFAIYGETLNGYSPLWIGIAIGAYGLTQAIFQIPMGILSDKFGRKPIILFGLVVFFIGSLVAANSDSIYGVVFGRALQGAGAIASAILALAADLTREDQRSKIMATIGMFIGLSFALAMVLGPIVAESVGLSGLFSFIAILTIFAMFMIQFIVPNSVHKAPKGDSVALPQQVLILFKHTQLSRLNIGVFILHLSLTACFVSLPKQFVEHGLALPQHWQLYLPSLFGSFVLMVPFMIWAMKKQKEKPMFTAAVAVLSVSLFCLAFIPLNLTVLFILIILFFTGFNYLEATMPSLLSRIAPAGVKGTVMGIFATSQFLGAFVGGILGGVILTFYTPQTLYFIMGLLCCLWCVITLSMQAVKKSKNFSIAMDEFSQEEADVLAAQLIDMPGVMEATLIPTESVAYLKIDDKVADLPMIKALIKG